MPWIMDLFGGRTPFIETDAVDPKTRTLWRDVIGLNEAAELSDVFRGKNMPFDPAELPPGLIVAKSRKSFPDMWTAVNSMLIISEALRDIIKSLDPNTHKIWPVAMITKRGERCSGPFFGFMPMVHASAISEKHSKVYISEEHVNPATPIMPEYVSPRYTRLRGRKGGYVYSSKLPSAHVWWDHGLTTNYLLISDALHGAIKDAKLKTLHFEKLSFVPETDDA